MQNYLTPKEVSQKLKVSKRTLRRWRSIGEGPEFSKFGERMVRYPEKAVKEYLENGED